MIDLKYNLMIDNMIWGRIHATPLIFIDMFIDGL